MAPWRINFENFAAVHAPVGNHDLPGSATRKAQQNGRAQGVRTQESEWKRRILAALRTPADFTEIRVLR